MTDKLCDFAVTCYQRSGVATCCLRLQDNTGADINMLLTAVWLSEQDRRWQHDEVRALIALCANWREHCVLPLRAVRRYLKDQKDQSKMHTLYTRTKALELEAEMHQLQLLDTALQSIALKNHGTADVDALTANLQTYFDCITPKQPVIEMDGRALIEALRR